MSIPRPKILSVITVPSGGLDLKLYVSDAAQYDTAITVTVPAGEYFMSGDNQSDDFLYQLQLLIAADLEAVFGANGFCVIDIDPDAHKVRFKFDGSEFVDATGDNDVKLAWTESDTDIYGILGFNGSADDTRTSTDNPRFTADYHHAYGWYSDEDGQLESLNLADSNTSESTQGRSIGGQSKTQYRGEYFDAVMVLSQIERDFKGRTKMLSDGVGYMDAPVHPYNRNEPLECWWREAYKGKRFRVYRDGFVNVPRSADRGEGSASGNTTFTDASKSWSIEPFRWVGRILHIATMTTAPAIGQSYYISSHTATVLTVGNPLTVHPIVVGNGELTYSILDHPYRTYVLDLGSMSTWDSASMEIPSIDRYNIEIPLMRYIA